MFDKVESSTFIPLVGLSLFIYTISWFGYTLTYKAIVSDDQLQLDIDTDTDTDESLESKHSVKSVSPQASPLLPKRLVKQVLKQHRFRTLGKSCISGTVYMPSTKKPVDSSTISMVASLGSVTSVSLVPGVGTNVNTSVNTNVDTRTGISTSVGTCGSIKPEPNNLSDLG
jgi:hypothetical protein